MAQAGTESPVRHRLSHLVAQAGNESPVRHRLSHLVAQAGNEPPVRHRLSHLVALAGNEPLLRRLRGSHDAWTIGVVDDAGVPVSVLIVDDHDDFRRSARALLEDQGVMVVGEARDGAEALALATRLRPALVLLDIQLPDNDGFAVAEQLGALDVPPIVVLISSRDLAVYQARLAASHARAFVAKRDLTGELVTALAS